MQRMKNFSTTTAGQKLGSLCLAALLALVAVVTADTAMAGGKQSGTKCKVSKSCASGLCVRDLPEDKFGTCCTPDTCAELNAQCGLIDNGCGSEINCGPCDGSCIDNQCIPATTSTSTTSSSSSTSSSSTSSSTSTSTTIPATTTTEAPTTTLEPAQKCSDDIQCDSGCCDFRTPGAWQCGETCCLGCWLMCYNACGCSAFPAGCNDCMYGCVPANCGCPYY